MTKKSKTFLSELKYRGDKEPEWITPAQYVDATLVMTKLATPPFSDQRVMEGPAQIFRVTVQTFGRRVAERLMIELSVAGATVSKGPAYAFLAHGYSTIQMDPHMVRQGEIVSVSTTLNADSRWWRRWSDSFWDWWSPPKARVIVTGVVRKPEVEA